MLRIKDGLFLGKPILPTNHMQLLTSKFGYVVNCAAEMPRLDCLQGINYTKLKIRKQSNHVLGEGFKRLLKLKSIIKQAEQDGLSCLVYCDQDRNRSVVLLTAYLVDRFKWKIIKALDYLKSKTVNIILTDRNIDELIQFQSMISKEFALSFFWTKICHDEEQELITKTYNNTKKNMFLKQDQSKPNLLVQTQKKQEKMSQKVQKRVTWQGQTENQQKFEKRQSINMELPNKYKDQMQNQQKLKLYKEHPFKKQREAEVQAKRNCNLTINNYVNPNIIIMKSPSQSGIGCLEAQQDKIKQDKFNTIFSRPSLINKRLHSVKIIQRKDTMPLKTQQKHKMKQCSNW